MYTLSDVGVLSNLIGSLSRTIQHRSPSREWIMNECLLFETQMAIQIQQVIFRKLETTVIHRSASEKLLDVIVRALRFLRTGVTFA